MGKPAVGQSRRISVELEPGGVMVFGPFRARQGMTVDLRSDGPVGVDLACADQATAVADAFVHDRESPSIATIGRADIRGRGRIVIKPTHCNVAFIARSTSATMVSFDWVRPPGEEALSTGGPVIRCPQDGTADAAHDRS